MITENLSTLKIHKLTQAQYDRELAAGRVDANALYLTPEEEIDLSPYATVEQVGNIYETKSDANSKLTQAKEYADNASNTVKNDLLNGAGAAYDTLKELGDLIDDNTDAISALEAVASGKADKVHSHAISDVSGLQSALDGKAASSHGTHVSYSTTAPVMDGTASVGTASTVARSDHKHPTDTSRAAKTDLDSHTSNTTAHITSTERSNWNAAKTHADSAHAPSNAQPNQNAFSNIKVGTTTVAADTTTDTLELVGSNVTITPDTTNDKITIAVADGSTSTAGILKLTNSTSSTSTTTAATPSSVKSAYDLANTAKTNAATAQTRADSAYTLAEGKVDSLSDLGITATATELNYVDGVTSNVQSQLDNKVSKVAGYISSSLSPDVKIESCGWYRFKGQINNFTPSGYITNLYHCNAYNSADENQVQIATSNTGSVQLGRYCDDGVWSDWKFVNEDYFAPISHISDKSNPHGVTIAQIGAAPAGYGLGEQDSNYISDCNSATGIGWYSLTGSTLNMPSASFYIGALRVERRGHYITQTAIAYLNEAKRNSSDGGATWNEWEYVNPPMIPGEEYRTTERWNGKEVWTVAVNVGTTAEGAVGATTDFTASEIIRFGGKIGTYANPQIYDNLSHAYTTWANVQSYYGKISITVWARSGAVNLPAVVQVWYTKD